MHQQRVNGAMFCVKNEGDLVRAPEIPGAPEYVSFTDCFTVQRKLSSPSNTIGPFIQQVAVLGGPAGEFGVQYSPSLNGRPLLLWIAVLIMLMCAC